MISELGKIIFKDSISSTTEFDNFFYKKAFALIISINLLTAIFFLALNADLGITFSFFTLIYSYVFIINYNQYHLLAPKITYALLLNIQALILIKYFNIGHATDWYFAIPAIYVLNTFQHSHEKKLKYLFLCFSIIAFIFAGINIYTNTLNLPATFIPLAQLIYRLNVVSLTVGLIIIWQNANRELIRFIKAEDKLVNDILNNLPLPIFCIDSLQNFNTVYQNDEAKKSLILKDDNFIFKSGISNKLSLQQKSFFRNEDINCLKEQRTISQKNAKVELENRETRYINYTKIPLFNRYILVIPENITAQVESNQDLFNYKYSLDQAAIISFADIEGNITYANDLFSEISQYQSHELIGKNHRILKSDKHDFEFYKGIWNKISNGKIWQGEICNRKKNGDLYWVFSTIIPNKDINGKIYQYISIRFDITHKKAIENKISQAEKFSVLGELAAGIMHEVNTPLTVLKNRSAMLRKKINQINQDSNDQLIKDIIAMNDSIERIAKITKGLKNYSRNSEKDPFENNELTEIIQESIILCQDKIKLHGIIFNFVQPEFPINISCRRSEISQIFINMINNSIDAIEILQDKWIKIELNVSHNEVVISFQDSGFGINEEVQEKMMQPFFTTKENGKGTGLGLSISQNILKIHGGKMTYIKDSKNTLFEITLPLLIESDQKQA